jgi:hypothetical protein
MITTLRTESAWHDFLIGAGYHFERYGRPCPYEDDTRPAWYRAGDVRVVCEDPGNASLLIVAMNTDGATVWEATLTGAPVSVVSALLTAAADS